MGPYAAPGRHYHDNQGNNTRESMKIRKQDIPARHLAKLFTVLFILSPCGAGRSLAGPPDTLEVFDAAALAGSGATELPPAWEHILPKGDFAYTNYSIERDMDGTYLRAMSSATRSWLEYETDDIDVERYPVMEWVWRINQFPETEWEMERVNDDFAMRIELVYDFKGGKNILNIIRKGLINTIFRGYPPELIVSYVWSLNVPAEEPYPSPSTKRMMIIPVESDVAMQGRWVHESRNIAEDLERFKGDKKSSLVLKKIRLRADTENVPTIAESGLKHLRLISKETSGAE